MGSVVTIGHLIIDFGDRSVGNSVSARCSEALDDSLGPEVLALLARGRRTELSGLKVVGPGVVGGLFVSYMCRGAGEEGPMAFLPSEGGIYGASVS